MTGSEVTILLLISFCTVFVCDAYNERPVIGVLTQAVEANSKPFYGDTVLPSNYVIFLQAAGARVVPIRMKKTEEYYKYLFNSLNGILFPGGWANLSTSGYSEVATLFYNWALKANDRGDFFPIWGTCLGFEMLMKLSADQNPLSDVQLFDAAVPVDFQNGYRNSRLFRDVPDDVRTFLATKNVTENFHKRGVLMKTYKSDKILPQFYQVLSTNKDDYGLEFISTAEGKHYPIYAVQWHPEKTMGTWNLNYHVTHHHEAVRVAQYMANFFVGETHKSNHKFATYKEELNECIENYSPIFHKDTTFNNYYYFNYTSNYMGYQELQPDSP